MILAACSGTGKSTIVRALTQRMPHLKLSVSHTTRAPRPDEVDGVAYHFIDQATFELMIKEGAFVEWAEYAGNYYGTSHAMIRDAERAGDDLIFEVEVEGAAALKRAYPRAVSCFLLPPSWDELESRLRGRKTESEEVIKRRLEEGRRELDFAHTFDHLVVNRDLEVAIEEVSCIYRALKLQTRHQRPLLDELLQRDSPVTLTKH